MGGNSRIIDRSTGKTIGRAEKIDLSIFNRTTMARRILSLFHALNEHFYEDYNDYIWEDFDLVSNGEAFSGSSKFFFDKSISNEVFISHKSHLGDIDIMIPSYHYHLFANLMQKLEGKEIAKGVTYLGQDRNNFGTTFLAVFRYTIDEKSVDMQIDFEAVDWEKSEARPTEWASFSHNSAWEDIIEGYKGVHHKFLLINLTRAISKREEIAIATPASKPEKVKLVTGKKAEQTPRTLAFSVDRGLREKYRQLRYNDGVPVVIDDKFIFQEIPTEESTYIKDVGKIFEKIFGHEPTILEYTMFHSFTGVLELMQMYIDGDEIRDCFEFTLQENLFGLRAQIIEKNDPNLDQAVKMKFVNRMFREFSYLKDTERVRTMAQTYKENFKYD